VGHAERQDRDASLALLRIPACKGNNILAITGPSQTHITFAVEHDWVELHTVDMTSLPLLALAGQSGGRARRSEVRIRVSGGGLWDQV
jgi:hypothetical protein